MSDTDGLCCGCLVVGRRVLQLRDSGFHDLYTELGNDPSSPVCAWGALCWECCALLRRLQTFRARVRTSQATLHQHLIHDPSLAHIDSIARHSPLQTHTAYAHQYPELVVPKETEPVKCESWLEPDKVEFEFIKSEDPVDSYMDGYSEPETFVNSIEPNEKEEKRRKEKDAKAVKGKKAKKAKEDKLTKKGKTKKKGKIKKIAKKKKKVKPVEDDESVASVNMDVSSDGLTDLESVVDFYQDEPTGSNMDVESTQKERKSKAKPKELEYDESEIKLILLTHEEMLKEREKETVADYYAKCPHQCKDCLVGFKYERTLLTHIETKHTEAAGPHECATCHVRLPTTEELTEHTRLHLQRYKCTVCGKRSPTLLPMIKHVRNHKEYKCEVCGVTSGSLFRHQTHVARQHKEKPQCAECGKVFSSRKTHRYHMNVIHKGQNRFPCPHCGKIYQWKSNLWRHIKNHKAQDTGELYCAPCDKKFSSIATYQQHMKISRRHVTEEEFNYMCSDCGKKFANKTRLKDHVDWEHLNKINYRCEICNKPFKSNTSLYVHMQNVHRNKDEKDNLCHVCGKSYQNIAKLKYHIVAMHTTETPYTCEQCPSSFSWYSSLYRHVKEVHEKVKLKKKRPRRKDGAPLPADPPPPPAQILHTPHQPTQIHM